MMIMAGVVLELYMATVGASHRGDTNLGAEALKPEGRTPGRAARTASRHYSVQNLFRIRLTFVAVDRDQHSTITFPRKCHNMKREIFGQLRYVMSSQRVPEDDRRSGGSRNYL